jgi:cytochrome P450
MAILCLLTTPSALRTLQLEIDEAIAAGRISSPIRDSEARQLPYLQAVIKECIRVYPPQTGLNYKEVPKGGASLFGYHLPAGTQVGVGIFRLTRSKEMYGPDADVFRPERWFEVEDEDQLREMSNVIELVFGHGKYQCLGKTIAAMELNKILVEVSIFPASYGECWNQQKKMRPSRS